MNITSPQRLNPGWAIVAAGFLALALAFSARATLGLVMPVWRSEFGWSSSYISAVGASALIVMAVIAPIAGRLLDRHGPRFTLILGLVFIGFGCALVALMDSKTQFVIGFAGFSAIGFGIVANHVVATIVTRSFHTHTGLATGIATSGSTGGQFLIVPLLAGLLAFVSWRWSFGAMSLASFGLIPCILSSVKSQSGTSCRNDSSKSGLRHDFCFILRKPTFHILFWSFLICGFTTTGVIETHFLPYASYCGFPPLPSATAYGVLSAVNLLGMIAAGWLTDRLNRPILLAAIYFLRALTFILLGSLPGTEVETLFLFAVLFGTVDYATVPVTASLVASHVGLRVMGLAMGMISAGHAIGGAMGAYLGGYVFDTTGNYNFLWIASLWLTVGAAAMVLLLPVSHPQAEPG